MRVCQVSSVIIITAGGVVRGNSTATVAAIPCTRYATHSAPTLNSNNTGCTLDVDAMVNALVNVLSTGLRSWSTSTATNTTTQAASTQPR